MRSWVCDKTKIFHDIIKNILLSEAINYQTAVEFIKSSTIHAIAYSATADLYPAVNFCANMTQQLQNFQTFTRRLYIVSLHKQIPSCIPTRKHLNASNFFTSEVTEMSRQSTKAFRILSKISFKERERQFSSNTVTQISMCGKTKFSKSAFKVVLQKWRVL
jgi:hypothetical protein